jgi:2,5-furandicarboxylate decarboxylase 1
MALSFRDHLDVLARNGKLTVVDTPVDLRYASALIWQARQGLWLRRPAGYAPQGMLGGIYEGKAMTALAYGCPFGEAWQKVAWARTHPMNPEVVASAADHEVVRTGDEVDLSELPVPVLAHEDGGPYISAAITSSQAPNGTTNWGVYRYQIVNRNTLAIDLTTQNNMHNYLKRAYREGKRCEVMVTISNHPTAFLSAAMDLPAGTDEMGVAGALAGEPVQLVRGTSVNGLAVANSEYIMEGEFLPGGWAHDEGRFGEFHGLMGSMHKNPVLRIKRLTRKADAQLYTLQMVHEINTMYQPITEMFARQALAAAGVEPVAINVSTGGCSAFHIIASIKKFPGAGKLAISALFGVGIVKHVVVVDDDIDVFNPEEVEWAIATRVQAERDVVIIPGMGRAKPLDPVIPPGMSPMLIARMGIDATIPENVPLSRYERIRYPHLDDVNLSDLLTGAPGPFVGRQGAEQEGAPLVDLIAASIGRRGAAYYMELVDEFAAWPHRSVIQAMGQLYDRGLLQRDAEGHYLPKATASS